MDYTKLFDMLSMKNVNHYYDSYMETQWFKSSDLAYLQSKKLFNLMDHCYAHVPFYRKAMLEKGLIPTDFNGISVLSEMPIIDKETIKSNYNDFIPIHISSIKGVKHGQTGGTTGSMLLKRNDANSRSSVWGAFKRFENWMGYSSKDKALILMGGHVIQKKNISYYRGLVKKNIVNILKNQIAINPYNTDSKTLNQIISILLNNNIGLIRGYSQYLFNVCQKMQMRNIKVNVPLVTTTAEPLMLEQRKIFKEILGAESFDQYGCGEIGGVAFECSEHEGMHITEERVIVEQTNNHDLIMTDLDNYAMPFVRYYNADQAVISNERCGCGREHRLIKQVMGRTCDYVVGMNDEYLHWAYFWHLIFDSGISKKRDLSKFQIEQESQNKIIFKYIAKQLDKDEEKLLTDSIQSKLGNVEVVFSQEHDIPNTATGKYRPVINNLLR